MKTKVKVIFRKWKDGTIDALMPYEVDVNYTVTCYSKVGQHSLADYNHCISVTKPAKPEEYHNLLQELESLGYEVTIIKKANKYLMANLWQQMKEEYSKMA